MEKLVTKRTYAAIIMLISFLSGERSYSETLPNHSPGLAKKFNDDNLNDRTFDYGDNAQTQGLIVIPRRKGSASGGVNQIHYTNNISSIYDSTTLQSAHPNSQNFTPIYGIPAPTSTSTSISVPAPAQNSMPESPYPR